MKKLLFILAALAASPVPSLAQGFVPGGTGVLSVKTKTPSSVPLFDSEGRPTGAMSPSAIYAGMVAGVSIAKSGAYAPSDLPVTLTFPQNNLGETAAASVSAYTAVSARVTAAGNNCPAASVYTIAGTGTKIIVSDGSGLSGSVVTVSVGGSAVASAVPANPVTPISTALGCTPPTFNLSWGVAAISLDNQGWGYTTAPAATGSASSATDAAVASIGTTLGVGEVNLPQKLIATSKVNIANGVSGLDGDADTTAGAKLPHATLLFKGSARGQMLGTYTDPWTPPNMMRMGGLQTGSPLAQQVNGMPDGPNDSGVVQAFSAYDGSFSGIRPGIGPDALSGGPTAIANYAALDTGVVSNQWDTPVPLVRAGADIKDWNGNTHTVTFGCGTPATTPNRVCFSPALPPEWVALLHRGQHILTNVIGPGKYPPATVLPSTQPDVLASQVNAVASDGSYIDTVGWAVPGSTISNGFVPMVSSYAGDGHRPAVAAGTLDTKWSNYQHAAVFIGASTSMFNNYSYCKLDHSGSHDDKKNINAADSMVHACTYLQHDMFNYDTDYTNSFTGMGLAYQGPSLPSSDSQMVWLSGYMPTFFRIKYTSTGIKLFDTDAGFEVDHPLVLPIDGTVGEASSRFLSAQEETINGIPLKLQKWAQMDGAIPSTATGLDFVNYASVRLGLNYGTGPNTHSVDPMNAGELLFNPNCGVGGIALAGGNGGAWTPSIGVCVQKDGSVQLLSNVSVVAGKSLSFYPTDTSGGWPFFYGVGSATVSLKTSSGNPANLTLTGNSTANNFTTLPGGGVLLVPSSNNGNIYASATSPNDVKFGASNGNGAWLHSDGLVAGKELRMPYGTPTKGAACTNGQVMADDDNDYTCHASVWTYQAKGASW